MRARAVLFVVIFSAAGCVDRPLPPPNQVRAQKVRLSVGEETVPAILYRPAGAGPFPAVVVVHDAYGLNDTIKEHAQHLADLGYLALAVDLYHGVAPGDLEHAHELHRGLPESGALADLRAAVDYLEARPDLRPEALGIVGWGMGGGLALDAAVADNRLKAVVTCYGPPRTEAAGLAGLEGAVLGLYAEKGPGVLPSSVKQFQSAMRAANKLQLEVHTYPGREDGFMTPAPDATPSQEDRDAAADVWKKIDDFLQRKLKS
jgi:carboxymethylenebutenolidase